MVTSTFDLLTLKVVSESRVTWATSVPILVFLGLSVLDLSPMYATDRETSDVRHHHCLMPSPIRGGGIITFHLRSLWTCNPLGGRSPAASLGPGLGYILYQQLSTALLQRSTSIVNRVDAASRPAADGCACTVCAN